MIITRTFPAAGLVAIVCLAGCGGSAPPPAKTGQPTSAVKIENAGAPLTEQESRVAAQAFVTAIASNKLADLDQVTDWNGVAEATVDGIETNVKFRGDFVRALPKAINQQFAQAVASKVTEGGTYKLLRVRQKDGKWTAIARLLQLEGGTNYHELTLVRRPDNTVRVVDMYIYASGETIAQTFRRIYLPLAAHENRGILERFQGKDSDFVKHFSTFEKMTTAFREKRPAEALAAYAQLPPSLRKDKMVLLVRIQAAQTENEDEYLSAIKAYENEFPEDPSLSLLLIDRHVLKKQHHKALVCIDKLEEQVGADPHFDVLRANMHLAMDKLPDARKAVEKAMAAEPDLIEAHWVRIALSLREKDFAATLEHLNELDQKFEVDAEQIRTFPGFEDFEGSPEFKKWAPGASK